MGEIFMMSKEQFLVIFYGKYILVFGILLWLCIHYCRKGFFRFFFEGMIECKLKKLLEQKKHFLEILFNILVLFLTCNQQGCETSFHSCTEIHHLSSDQDIDGECSQ